MSSSHKTAKRCDPPSKESRAISHCLSRSLRNASGETSVRRKPRQRQCNYSGPQGGPQIPCLERSFQELIRRHEVFRTTFHVVGDAPVQRIAPYRPIKLNVVDLGQVPDAEAEAARFAFKEKTDSVDLERGPLMRFSLLRFGAPPQARAEASPYSV